MSAEFGEAACSDVSGDRRFETATGAGSWECINDEFRGNIIGTLNQSSHGKIFLGFDDPADAIDWARHSIRGLRGSRCVERGKDVESEGFCRHVRQGIRLYAGETCADGVRGRRESRA